MKKILGLAVEAMFLQDNCNHFLAPGGDRRENALKLKRCDVPKVGRTRCKSPVVWSFT